MSAGRKPAHKKQALGQFFTPPETARFMAKFYSLREDQKHIRILDPGTGSGLLSCALAEKIAKEKKSIRSIELICYEIDDEVIRFTKLSLDHLKNWISNYGIKLEYELRCKDFVEDNKNVLQETSNLDGSQDEKLYDVIISNPPFFKLSKEDARHSLVSHLIAGQINIYSVFIFIASKMLKENGEMIFLIPRSFCAGNFFRQFREKLLSLIKFEHIHLLGSGAKIFKYASVLSETVMVHARRNSTKEKVSYKISTSFSEKNTGEADFRYSFLFDPKENIIPLPSCASEAELLEDVKSWKGSLKENNIQGNTGQVVLSKLSKDSLTDNSTERHTEKALVLGLNNSGLNTPKLCAPESYRGEFIEINERTWNFLVPNKNCILLRRYNTKHKDRRIAAVAFLRKSYEGNYIAFEKQVIFLSSSKGELSENETKELAALLNSEKIDQYLKIIYGDINVTPEELLNLPLPLKE
ncbi:MAG: N-6 DNA methylase [Bacteroidota bacterium]|nr:N-6 DNA methylase [Bacteroidota bacterium]